MSDDRIVEWNNISVEASGSRSGIGAAVRLDSWVESHFDVSFLENYNKIWQVGELLLNRIMSLRLEKRIIYSVHVGPLRDAESERSGPGTRCIRSLSNQVAGEIDQVLRENLVLIRECGNNLLDGIIEVRISEYRL